LYALSASSGSVMWTYKTTDQIESSVALSGDGKAYVGSDDNTFSALDAHSGKPLWVSVLHGSVQGSPAIGADGSVYVGTSAGYVYGFGPE
jgi:outer membrane protein assembly factor BamB